MCLPIQPQKNKLGSVTKNSFITSSLTLVLGLSFDQVWVPDYTSFHPSEQAKFSYHGDQLCVIQSLLVIFSVSWLTKIVYKNVHKKGIQEAVNMKHTVNDIYFPIISVHVNISKLRSGPKCPLFSNPLTIMKKDPPSTLFLSSKLGEPAKRGGSQECRNCRHYKESVEHVLFECASYDSQKQYLLDYMKQVLAPEAFKVSFTAAFSIKLCFVWVKNKVC